MARGLPKPWLKTRPNGKREYFVTLNINGKQKQKFLAEEGTSEVELQRRLILLLADASAQKGEGTDPGVVAIINLHLDHVKANLSAKTYEMRRWLLLDFRNYLKSKGLLTITCSQLKPFHVNDWLVTHSPKWGQNTRNIAVNVVKTCVNWSRKQGLLEKRVLELLEIPAYIPRGEEVLLTKEQRQIMLEHCGQQEHRDLLIALYGSGCRPGEVTNLQAECVHLDCECPFWVVRGKRTKRHPDGVRRVALTPILVELSKRLLLKHPTGHLFRNTEGNPWNKSSMKHMFHRIREKLKKAGFRMPAKIFGYGLRHNFCTDLLAGGASDSDVSRLMGHAGTDMVHRVYSHLSVESASRALKHLNEVSDPPNEQPPNIKIFPETA